jgi:hypothetical protein
MQPGAATVADMNAAKTLAASAIALAAVVATLY